MKLACRERVDFRFDFEFVYRFSKRHRYISQSHNSLRVREEPTSSWLCWN